MSSHNTIAAGIATTRTTPTDNDQRTRALRNLAAEALDQHPDRPGAAETALREVAEALGLITPKRSTKSGHCTSCGKPRSIQDASPHTANPVGICTACRRGTRKTATQPITERA